MDTFLRDARYSLRVLLKEPGFTSLAILTLTLGIGATTAIFTVVHSVLLRPLPYADPERLVVALHGPEASAPLSPADFLDYRREAQAFERLAAAQAWGVTLGGGDRPERVAALRVSADMLDLLGVPALLGRTFLTGEDQPGHDQVIVLSHGLWQRRFGRDRGIVGRGVIVDGQPATVIGVMPPSFRFAPFWQTRAELWAPLPLTSQQHNRDGRSLRVFGRLKPGVTVAQAQQEMSSIAARLAREYPGTNTGLSITVRPLLEKVVSGIRSTLLALMSMVTFVLLIACANVSSSALTRAAERQQEIAVRLALGARPWRVVRQLLTESLLLASAGAVVGFALAAWGVHRLMALVPPGSLPRQHEVGFDSGVYIAATLASLLAGVATGLLPALQIVRPGLVRAFQGGPRGATEPRGRKRARSLLVGAQVALALVLLVGAGLMGRTMLALNRIDPGFRMDHLAVAGVSLAGTPHASPDARYAMYERIRDRLAVLPGVISVSAINHLPLAGDVWNLGYTIEGRAPPAPGQRWSAVYRVVEPGYFSTAGIRLLAGREFAGTDRATSIPVAIISKGMADRRWPGGGALGQRLHLPGPSNLRVPVTIVGIAGDARQGEWTSPPGDEVYVALAQRSAEFGLAGLTFLLRTSTDPAAAAASVPGAIGELDPGVAVSSVTTMETVMADAIWRQRLTSQLTGAFALVALLLSAIGIYAAVGYAVARRTREFGVRMALGGSPHQMLGLALVDGLRPVLAGAALGIFIAIGASRVAERLLFGVAALDPLTFGVAILTILCVGAGAACVPARRAARQDPVVALRQP